MARKRMIDPNIWESEDFNSLSLLSRLVFIGLFSNADDEGRGRAKPIYIKSILFPYDEKIRPTDIENSLSEIASRMSIILYSHDGNEYYALKNWDKWQSIQKKKMSIFPAPPQVNDEYSTSTVPVQYEYSLKEKNRKEKKGKEDKYISPRGSMSNVLLTDDEYTKLSQQMSKAKVDEFIEKLSLYIASTGKKYQSHYATILNWYRKDGGKKAERPAFTAPGTNYDAILHKGAK